MALIVHVPACNSVTDEPETVQTVGVVEAYVTARPDVAEAVSVTGPWSSRTFDGLKVIVWLPFAIEKLCVTCVAAFQSLLPPWFALIVHVPTCSSVTDEPETEQTVVVVEPYVAPRPDD